jgi:ABC-2 type transport system permease protein
MCFWPARAKASGTKGGETMRVLWIVGKELKCVKEDPSFNMVTVLSPLLFLFAFWLMLSGGVTLPVQVYPDVPSSAFLETMERNTAPDGTPYMELQLADEAVPPTNAESNLIAVEQEPTVENGVIEGKIVHYLNDVNENMTKNFRNRLDGALKSYIEEQRSGNVAVAETTAYEQDIPWNTGFGVSVFVFGLALAGLLFGMLSMTSEGEKKTTKLLKLSPLPASTMVAGKVIANIIKCFVSGAVFLLVFFLISQILPVSALTFSLTLLLVYGVFVCLGMCIGIFIKSTLTAFLISMATALTLWVGGGGFGPLSYFGDVAGALGSVNPATYAIELIRWSYFGGATGLAGGFAFLVIAFAVALSLILALYTRWVKSEVAK